MRFGPVFGGQGRPDGRTLQRGEATCDQVGQKIDLREGRVRISSFIGSLLIMMLKGRTWRMSVYGFRGQAAGIGNTSIVRQVAPSACGRYLEQPLEALGAPLERPPDVQSRFPFQSGSRLASPSVSSQAPAERAPARRVCALSDHLDRCLSRRQPPPEAYPSGWLPMRGNSWTKTLYDRAARHAGLKRDHTRYWDNDLQGREFL